MVSNRFGDEGSQSSSSRRTGYGGNNACRHAEDQSSGSCTRTRCRNGRLKEGFRYLVGYFVGEFDVSFGKKATNNEEVKLDGGITAEFRYAVQHDV